MGTYTGALVDEVNPALISEGNVNLSRMSPNRCLYVVLRDAAGNERGLNINADGTLTIAMAGGDPNGDAQTASLADAVDLLRIMSGIDGGAGKASDKTQRVIHATDDPTLALLAAILAKPGTQIVNVTVPTATVDPDSRALEAGGNLDLIAELLGILTQADAGFGLTTGNTQRVVHSSDDPLLGAVNRLAIPAPVVSVTTPTPQGQAPLMFETDRVDASGSTVMVDGPVEAVPQAATYSRQYALTVSTTAVQIIDTNVNRKALLITNNSAGDLYLKTASDVTTSGATVGLKLGTGTSFDDSDFGVYLGPWWGIYSAVASTQNVGVFESS